MDSILVSDCWGGTWHCEVIGKMLEKKWLKSPWTVVIWRKMRLLSFISWTFHFPLHFQGFFLQSSVCNPSWLFFYNTYICVCMYACCVLGHFSRVQLFATPWTVALQASLSMGLPRQEYWNGLPYPPPGDLPDPGIKPKVSPASQADSLLLSPRGSLCVSMCMCIYIYTYIYVCVCVYIGRERECMHVYQVYIYVFVIVV